METIHGFLAVIGCAPTVLAKSGSDVHISGERTTGAHPHVRGECMSKIVYEIVEHDGGWAYKADGVFLRDFPVS